MAQRCALAGDTRSSNGVLCAVHGAPGMGCNRIVGAVQNISVLARHRPAWRFHIQVRKHTKLILLRNADLPVEAIPQHRRDLSFRFKDARDHILLCI